MTIGVKLGTEPVGANGVKIVSSDGLKIAFLSLARFRGYKGRANRVKLIHLSATPMWRVGTLTHRHAACFAVRPPARK